MAINIDVISIPNNQAKQWLLKRHYAKRMCPISYAFGAYREHDLIGVVTYGTPMSATLRVGICGEYWQDCVLELNRLCCENTKNIASLLVGRSLQMLPKPTIVVSYADIGQGHVGYIYQATNFVYTGLSANRTDLVVKGLEHMHNSTVQDKFRGQTGRREKIEAMYGEHNVTTEVRDRKHRYVFFCGDKWYKRDMKNDLKYKIEPYPKGETKRYEGTGTRIATMKRLFL